MAVVVAARHLPRRGDDSLHEDLRALIVPDELEHAERVERLEDADLERAVRLQQRGGAGEAAAKVVVVVVVAAAARLRERGGPRRDRVPEEADANVEGDEGEEVEPRERLPPRLRQRDEAREADDRLHREREVDRKLVVHPEHRPRRLGDRRLGLEDRRRAVGEDDEPRERRDELRHAPRRRLRHHEEEPLAEGHGLVLRHPRHDLAGGVGGHGDDALAEEFRDRRLDFGHAPRHPRERRHPAQRHRRRLERHAVGNRRAAAVAGRRVRSRRGRLLTGLLLPPLAVAGDLLRAEAHARRAGNHICQQAGRKGRSDWGAGTAQILTRPRIDHVRLQKFRNRRREGARIYRSRKSPGSSSRKAAASVFAHSLASGYTLATGSSAAPPHLA